jgi:hypothetical protein
MTAPSLPEAASSMRFSVVGGLDGAEHGVGDLRLGQEAGDGAGEVGADLVVGLVAVVGFDAGGGDEDRLRGGAHLAGIQRQREGEVAEHRACRRRSSR